jgi:hypothetical protein
MDFYLNDYLFANGISLRKRVSDLFDELEKNPELAQVFIRNPILVLQSKILPEFGVLGEDSINAANQFLYSALSNDKFKKWLGNYQTKLIDQYNKTGRLPNKKKVLQEFAKGLIENGDPKILSDLLEISPKFIESSGQIPPPRPIPTTDVLLVYRISVKVYLAILVMVILVDCLYVYDSVYAAGITVLDENQKIISVSPKELKLLTEQIVKYAKKMRKQKEENTLEK